MLAVEVLTELGGVASWTALAVRCTRAELDAAVRVGEITQVARGRYVLPSVADARQTAARMTGVLSHESAALEWGWAVKLPPERPHVIVRRNRKLTLEQRQLVLPHWAELHPGDVVGGRTSRERTVADCLRFCPEDAALAVADSVLRDGQTPRWLCAVVRDLRGPGAPRARKIAALANELADNPFESVLRSIARRVSGIRVRPQVPLYAPDGEFLGRPDLVDEERQIVLEADSFEWHGSRAALRRDCRRYNALVVNGWLVLRFTWEDVMFHPQHVLGVLTAAAEERAHWRLGRHGAA